MSSLEKDPAHDCAICRDGLRDPRTLPCFHSFCLGCLQESLRVPNSLVADGTPNSSTCPLCRVAFEIPKREGVAALLVDPFVLNLNKQKESLASVNPNDVQCVCEDEPALLHCDICEEFYGEKCLKAHSRAKKTSNHPTQSIDDYFKASGPGSRRLFCHKHRAFEMDTYCKQCQQAMCPSCVVPDHANHQGLVKLADVATDFSGELKQAAATVRSNLFLLITVTLLNVIRWLGSREGEPAEEDHW